MPKVKTTYAYKIQSTVKEFPDESMEVLTINYFAISVTVRFLATNAFLLILIEIRRNIKKRQEADLKILSPQTSQTFLRSSDTDFVEKVTKAVLSADIPLYKLNNTHIKNLLREIGHKLPPETTCRRTALQLSEDELKRIRNAVHDKQIFLIVDESTLSGTQYLNILVGKP